jgi:Fe-S cluster assembly iron-binding protein IscA
MLQITENAALTLAKVRDAQGIPASHGVRLSGSTNESGQHVVRIAFVEAPDQADHVAEQTGTEVYLAPEVADPLSDAVMDVEETEAGPQLIFRPQAS